jgi:hypothetical protein
MRFLDIVYAVVRASGIEMASGSGEGGAVAPANIVNVDAVLTGRKLGDIHEDLDAVRDGREFGVANSGSLRVNDVGMSGFRRGGRGDGS